MKVIGIIPARLDSSRFPGKPLEKIHGMPMVGHCYHRTALALGIQNTFVATCDFEIFEYIESIGGKVIMTSNSHTRATTRTAEALEKIESEVGETIDIIVMVQGDEPLIPPEAIKETINHFSDKNNDIVNIMSKISSKQKFEDKNNVKVVVDNSNNALYFSRESIPSPWKGWRKIPKYMQTGVIAFRREVLFEFNARSETELEQIESVDMNRVLETGGAIKMVLIEEATIGVDVPNDIIEAQKKMVGDKVMKGYL